MIDNSAKEKQTKELDPIAGRDIEIGDLYKPQHEGEIIQYNQDEFKTGSYYCTAYSAFSIYSNYTGYKIPKGHRKEFIDYLINNNILIEGKGAYLDDVLREFLNFLKNKGYSTIPDLISIRVDNSVRKTLQDNNWLISTGFLATDGFLKDKEKDCKIGDVYESEKAIYGHAHNEDNGYILDNYSYKECNIYEHTKYNQFIESTNHFTYGYIYAFHDKDKEDLKKIKIANDLIEDLAQYYDNDKADPKIQDRVHELADSIREIFPELKE